MKTKTLLLAGLISSAAVASSFAQTVYSVNAVGYVNVEVPVGFSMIANPLQTTDNKISTIFQGASIPSGTTLFKFNSDEGRFTESATFFGGVWQPSGNMTLAPGEGVFIPTSEVFTVTFAGEVSQGESSNIAIGTGFSIVSSTVPTSVGLDSVSFPALDGDTVFQWNNSQGRYTSATFFGGIWQGPTGTPTPAVGESFWVAKAQAATWTRNFSVSSSDQ